MLIEQIFELEGKFGMTSEFEKEAKTDDRKEHEKGKDISIVVNGERHAWPKGDISYEDVAKLAFPESFDTTTIYSIKYRNGHGEKPEGNLVKGASVKVKDGMIFTAKDTGES